MSTQAAAIPGTVVPAAAQVSPGGPQGLMGTQGASGPNAVSTDPGNLATLGSDNLILVPQAQLWSTRLRSFNAIGNPTFEVDQATCGTVLSNPIALSRLSDRWFLDRSGSLTGAVNTDNISTAFNKIPGTSFVISRSQLQIMVGTVQTTLAGNDHWQIYQNVEGPNWRELWGDVHSISLLVNSSVAPLTFAVTLRDSPITKSLVSLLTVPTPNVWTLLTLPNLPVFPGGNFQYAPGIIGYVLGICVACGTTFQAPATGTWQTGNFIGAAGMSNFLANPVNSSFNVAFVQHEPGPLCTTLIDKSFSDNYDECQRYCAKSYPYATAPGTTLINGAPGLWSGSAWAMGWIGFPKRMAKIPTLTYYNPNNGAANQCFSWPAGTNLAIGTQSPWGITDMGVQGFAPTGVTANQCCFVHWVADTGM